MVEILSNQQLDDLLSECIDEVIHREISADVWIEVRKHLPLFARVRKRYVHSRRKSKGESKSKAQGS
jgi:hypothetical protein